MRISRVQIRNFRNFHHLDLRLDQHAVIVGENKIGKSNLVFALRLLLDPSLPDSARQLRFEDFWDGLPKPPPKDAAIEVSVELTHFDDSDELIALLGDYLISGDPMTARPTFRFQPLQTLEGNPKTESDYEFLLYGEDRPENPLTGDVRRRIPLMVLDALRDAEADLERWRQSPLRPLLDAVSADIGVDELAKIAGEVEKANALLSNQAEVRSLVNQISNRLEEMVGKAQDLGLSIGFSPTRADRLIRALRLFIDGGMRPVSDASLGSANVLYLALKTLELQRLIDERRHSYTLLAIEEPEAHLHPHLQRLIYRDFLRTRTELTSDADEQGKPRFVILTTHSPHIVSVTPIRSLVVLKKSEEGSTTVGVSTANLELSQTEIADLERYLDVTRGEILFAKAVLLVEGMAEEFLVPRFSRSLGYDFDQLGITVCSVEGTNFEPYVKLLGTRGLQIPFAVLTDMDPQPGGSSLGIARAARLLATMVDADAVRTALENGSLPELASQHGIFLNSSTLEIDLWQAGAAVAMCDSLIELAGEMARERAETYRKDPPDTIPEELLGDILATGKGRFAQRLCAHLRPEHCPEYIRRAIEHVVNGIR